MNNEELLAKYKALFPDNVEAIVVRKDDYDRLYGDLTIENIKLKQEIEKLREENDIAEEKVKSAIKEIERLNKCIKDDKENADEIIAEQQKEIERLNNIITELEEYSENMISEYNEAIEEAVDNIDRFNLLGARSSYREISNKIKELKGSDKE